MIESFFTKETVDKHRPHIQKTAESLLDKMIKKGCSKPVDLIEEFAMPLPSYVS